MILCKIESVNINLPNYFCNSPKTSSTLLFRQRQLQTRIMFMIVSFCSATSAPPQNVCRAWVGGNALLYHHRLYLVSPQQPTARETKIVVYNLASGGAQQHQSTDQKTIQSNRSQSNKFSLSSQTICIFTKHSSTTTTHTLAGGMSAKLVQKTNNSYLQTKKILQPFVDKINIS